MEAAGNRGGWSITVETQPPQSPDLNLNDLSIFASLQAQQRATWTYNIKDLLVAVQAVWEGYKWHTIELAWQTLFNVYNCILETDGDNNFKIPHTGARARLTRGDIVRHAPVLARLVTTGRRFCRAHGVTPE